MKVARFLVLIGMLWASLEACTTLDKYDFTRDSILPNDDKYATVRGEVSQLANSLDGTMHKYNNYIDEYERIGNVDVGIDFSIALYFLSVNTTASLFTFGGMRSEAQGLFGVGNIMGTAMLSVQTLLKATFYEQRKKELEQKLLRLNEAITTARSGFLKIDSFTDSGEQILTINATLQESLISDIHPAFASK